jgi:hypothetical protein
MLLHFHVGFQGVDSYIARVQRSGLRAYDRVVHRQYYAFLYRSSCSYTGVQGCFQSMNLLFVLLLTLDAVAG